MRTDRRPTTGIALAVLVGVLAGCTGSGTPAPAPSPSAAGTELPVSDPDAEALAALVVELGDTVTALRAELEAAAAGDAAALERAAELLVADVEAARSEEAARAGGAEAGGDLDADDPATDASEVDATAGPPPLLPGPRSSREESIQYGDLLTRTLAAARGAGSNGEPVLRFLADPLAGDLGAWQRAPDDQLAAIARAGTEGDLAATEQAVLDLAGEAPRALAWVVHGLDVPDDAAASAGRALAHLTVIDLALDQLG